MSLKKQFNKTKNKQSGQLLITLASIAVSLGLVYVLNLLWNYLAPVWGLPNLSYLQFVGTLFLIHVLKNFFSFKATERGFNPNIKFIELIGKNPHEQQ